MGTALLRRRRIAVLLLGAGTCLVLSLVFGLLYLMLRISNALFDRIMQFQVQDAATLATQIEAELAYVEPRDLGQVLFVSRELPAGSQDIIHSLQHYVPCQSGLLPSSD